MYFTLHYVVTQRKYLTNLTVLFSLSLKLLLLLLFAMAEPTLGILYNTLNTYHTPFNLFFVSVSWLIGYK